MLLRALPERHRRWLIKKLKLDPDDTTNLNFETMYRKINDHLKEEETANEFMTHMPVTIPPTDAIPPTTIRETTQPRSRLRSASLADYYISVMHFSEPPKPSAALIPAPRVRSGTIVNSQRPAITEDDIGNLTKRIEEMRIANMAMQQELNALKGRGRPSYNQTYSDQQNAAQRSGCMLCGSPNHWKKEECPEVQKLVR
ncbi:hypothetical protein AA313_de0203982 [Arthrobotrys entomopaga]|nr:hypothetical protein AA313_de0203982 [Arthrobotrys entomopaga]